MRHRLASVCSRASVGLVALPLAAGCSGPDTGGVFGGGSGGAGGSGPTVTASTTASTSTTSASDSSSSSASSGAAGGASTSVGGGGPGGGGPGGGGPGGGGPGGGGPGGGGSGFCGDGVADGGEDCDGPDLGGASCESLGLPAGKLQCGPKCAFDTSGCGSSCGNGSVEAGEECDDGDGEDLNGCSNACTLRGRDCATAIPVALALGTRTIEGTTAGGGDHEPKGTQTCKDAKGPDLVYAVTPAVAGFLTARLVRGGGGAATDYDSVLYARSTCGSDDSQLLCADSYDPVTQGGLPGGELLSFRVQAGSPVYLFVDGYEGASGRYRLELDLSSGVSCADPVPVVIEEGTPMTLTGGTLGMQNDAKASCSAANAPDVVYAIRRAEAGLLRVEVANASFDTALYLQSTCGGDVLACDDDGGSGGEVIETMPPANSALHFWVDAATNNSGGPYRLVVRP